MEIDWESLAIKVGALRDGQLETGSNKLAAAALCEIIGDKAWKEAVDRCLAAAPGFGLTQSVLSLLRPKAASEHCYSLYKSKLPIEDRRFALVLLKTVANRNTIYLIPEFLNDPDELIQVYGAEILDKLVLDGWVDHGDEEVARLMDHLEQHTNSAVRERVALTKEQISMQL